MIRITIRETGADDCLAGLAGLVRRAEPGGSLGRVLGKAAGGVLVKHFRKLGRKRNRLGGKRTHFWSRVAQGVQSPRVAAAGRITVEVSHPHIAQKVYGGTIRPRRAKSIAVPVAAKAHGRAPKSFPLLAWLPAGKAARRKGTKGYLVKGVKKRRKRGPKKGTTYVAALPKGRGALLYVLKKEVRQAPQRDALPGRVVMLAALKRAARILLRKKG